MYLGASGYRMNYAFYLITTPLCAVLYCCYWGEEAVCEDPAHYAVLSAGENSGSFSKEIEGDCVLNQDVFEGK
jgi:hypothetical protein